MLQFHNTLTPPDPMQLGTEPSYCRITVIVDIGSSSRHY